MPFRLNRSAFTLITLLALLTVFASCRKETIEPPVEMGYYYFPTNVGHWVTYEVDSIGYNDFTGTSDTFHFHMREYFESAFNDLSGKPAVRIERYRKDNDTTDWYVKDVWYANRTASTAEKVEENVRIIKLVFAVEKGRSWNGNAYNVNGDQMYEYQNVDVSYTINGMTFDSSLTVMQKESMTLINRDYQVEVYAKNVGLIYKKYVQITTEVDGTIVSGTDYSYTIQSWGN